MRCCAFELYFCNAARERSLLYLCNSMPGRERLIAMRSTKKACFDVVNRLYRGLNATFARSIGFFLTFF
mgnify:CR=1 FL=1